MATKSAVNSIQGSAGAAADPDVPLSTKPPRLNLPCKVEVFQKFCQLAWGYCEAALVRFSADSPRFTPTFVEQQLELVTGLDTLPSLRNGRGATKMARTKLKVAAQAVRMLAQKLKTYILYAYPDKALAETALTAAGLKDYAGNETNWGKISAMVKSVNTFIEGNAAKLSERNNMPGDFPAAFKAAGVTFETVWTDFIAKEKAVNVGTGMREEALQKVLVELLPMLETGRRIFIFEPIMRKQFTARALKAEVQGHHPAGVKGQVTELESGRRLANVQVTAVVEGIPRTALTDAKGKYQLKLPNGVYELVFSSVGMEPFTVAERLVRPGVMGLLNVELQPAPAAVPPQAKALNEPASPDAMLRNAINSLATNGEVEAG